MYEGHRTIEWRHYGVTELGSLTLWVTIALMLWTLFGSSRRNLAPLLIAIAILPSVQRVVIFGLDFPMVRLLMAVTWLVVLIGPSRGQFRMSRLNSIDKWLIAWVLIGSVAYVLRKADGSAVVYKLGVVMDALGIYFLVRYRVWRSAQFTSGLKVLAVLSIVLGIATGIEMATGHNYFSAFGSALAKTVVRDGEFRAVASFSHPIHCGTFGALAAASMVGLWNCGRARVLAALGLIGACQVVIASSSSGPLIALGLSLACWLLWHVRHRLSQIRRVALILAVLVHFARDKPVWHLILRAGQILGGGTGFHRYYLIEATLNNWKQWVVLGTNDTSGWGYGLQDLTNHWVFEAIHGGLATLVAFNALLFVCFRDLGRAFRRIDKASELSAAEKRQLLFLGWTQGIVLTGFCVSFISVALFGQLNALFYLQLALIANFTELQEIDRPAKSAVREPWRTTPIAAAPIGAAQTRT